MKAFPESKAQNRRKGGKETLDLEALTIEAEAVRPLRLSRRQRVSVVEAPAPAPAVTETPPVESRRIEKAARRAHPSLYSGDHVGAQLKRDAEAKGYNGADVARLTSLSPATVSRCFNGQRNPVPWEALQRIAQIVEREPEAYEGLPGYPTPAAVEAAQARAQPRDDCGKFLARPPRPPSLPEQGLSFSCDLWALMDQLEEQIGQHRVATALRDNLLGLPAALFQLDYAGRPEHREARRVRAHDMLAEMEANLMLAVRLGLVPVSSSEPMLAKLSILRRGLQGEMGDPAGVPAP